MSNSQITVVGNATQDPELRFFEGGSGKTTFGIAVDRSYKKNDEWVNEVSFFNVVAWKNVAEDAARVVAKGVNVIVTGRLEQRSYETKEGEKRTVVEIIADNIGINCRHIESFEKVAPKERVGAGASTSNGQRRQAPAQPAIPAEEAW